MTTPAAHTTGHHNIHMRKLGLVPLLWSGGTLLAAAACTGNLRSPDAALAPPAGWAFSADQVIPTYGVDGMVSTTDRVASEVGAEVLRRGGNAVDAAVATHFALAVVNPEAGNIGGGGFMIVRLADGTTAALDFREKAPLAATRDMYLDSTGKVSERSSDISPRACPAPSPGCGKRTSASARSRGPSSCSRRSISPKG